jgi:hypothetical protein
LRGDLDEVVVAGAVEVQLVLVSQVLGGDDSCREVEPTDVVAAEPHQRCELREAVGGLREDEAPLALAGQVNSSSSRTIPLSRRKRK